MSKRGAGRPRRIGTYPRDVVDLALSRFKFEPRNKDMLRLILCDGTPVRYAAAIKGCCLTWSYGLVRKVMPTVVEVAAARPAEWRGAADLQPVPKLPGIDMGGRRSIVERGATETGRRWEVEREDRGRPKYVVWFDGCEWGGEFSTLDQARASAKGEQ